MVTKQLRNPQALSSTLTALGMLQPRALGFLNRLVTLVLATNFYIFVTVFENMYQLCTNTNMNTNTLNLISQSIIFLRDVYLLNMCNTL